PQIARSPAPVVMATKKNPGTCRIFILGESAALGDPRPAFGPGRYLKALLEEKCPGTRFEVVCVAMTAINSHVVLPIARECVPHEGDFWIVYLGNNEFVGPFGATTVFGARAPAIGSVRLGLALQRLRVGQLFMAVLRKLNRETTKTSWGGMKMFLQNQVGPDDPSRKAVAQNFQRNLQDILKTGLDAHVKILLNTVAVNLKDCPPFASLLDSNRPASDLAFESSNFEQAIQAESKGNLAAAVRSCEQLVKSDPQKAQAHFLLGTLQS